MNIKPALKKLDELENIRKCGGHVRIEWLREILLSIQEPEDDKPDEEEHVMNFTCPKCNFIAQVVKKGNRYGMKEPSSVSSLNEACKPFYKGDGYSPSSVSECEHAWHTSPIDQKQYCRHCGEPKDVVGLREPEPSSVCKKHGYGDNTNLGFNPECTCEPSSVSPEDYSDEADPQSDGTPSSVSECKHKCEKHGQTNCIACYEPKPTKHICPTCNSALDKPIRKDIMSV
jgi:hypothetical protein